MRSLVDIADAMVTALEAATWSGSPAFGEVKRFHSASLADAYERLYLTKQRAAVVVFDTADFSATRMGGKVQVRRTAKFWVIVTDRVLGNVDDATFGVAGSNPGAITLAQIAVDALTGQLFTAVGATNDTALVPVNMTFLTLASDQDKLPNRVAMQVQFNAIGAYDTAPLGSDFNG